MDVAPARPDTRVSDCGSLQPSQNANRSGGAGVGLACGVGARGLGVDKAPFLDLGCVLAPEIHQGLCRFLQLDSERGQTVADARGRADRDYMALQNPVARQPFQKLAQHPRRRRLDRSLDGVEVHRFARQLEQDSRRPPVDERFRHLAHVVVPVFEVLQGCSEKDAAPRLGQAVGRLAMLRAQVGGAA